MNKGSAADVHPLKNSHFFFPDSSVRLEYKSIRWLDSTFSSVVEQNLKDKFWAGFCPEIISLLITTLRDSTPF